jgi:hypothetical protein
MELARYVSAPHLGAAPRHRFASARSPGRLLVLALAAALLALLLSGSAFAEEPPRLPVNDGPTRVVGIDPTGVTGTVSVRGCTPDAADIDLRAIPLTVGAPGFEPVALDPRQTQLRARVHPTTNPHAHGFSIDGLRPGIPYAMSIALSSTSSCPRVFWRSASHGIAVGGSSVDIDGVAVTTTLEVLDPKTQEWVGADELDFADPQAGKRTFRWRSTLPGVVGGQLQISTAKFPTTGAFGACDEPDSGVVYRRQLTANETEVDFDRVLSRESVGESAFRLLEVGAPLYARVLPRTAAGTSCDTDGQGVSGWVVLGKPHAATPALPPLPSERPILTAGLEHVYTPPWLASGGDQGHPTYLERGYRVVKGHTLPTKAACEVGLVPPASLTDPLGCALVTSGKYPGGATLTEANHDWFYLGWVSDVGGGGSVLEDTFVPLVTGPIEAFGVAVTAAAELYEDIKDAVKKLAYETLVALPGIGDVCESYEDACKQAISTGLTIAMTAMGLPPSIPNWQQLKQEGIDYLAAEAGEQIEESSGIPGSAPVAEWALKQLAQEALDELTANRSGAGGAYDWVVAYAGMDPASWVVEVKKFTTDPLPPNVVLKRYTTNLYRGGDLPLPRTFPESGTLRIPMVLQPNLAGIDAPLCRASFYTDPQAQCVAVPGATAPVCQYQTNGDWYAGAPWHDDPGCARHGELVAIYYRDTWVAKKLDVQTCTWLGVATLLKHVEISPSQGDGEWWPLGTSWTTSVSYKDSPLLTMSVNGFVPPKVGATWSGPFFKAC